MGLVLLPAGPGRCVQCAALHGELDPHNFGSIYYAMRFKLKWGRSPTQADCVAHLPESRRELYRRVLPDFGIEWTEPDHGEPIGEPYAASH